jgi:hypothetical protein
MATMTRSDFAKRAATFFLMIVAGFFLGTYLDQRFSALDAEDSVTSSGMSQANAVSLTDVWIDRSLTLPGDGD